MPQKSRLVPTEAKTFNVLRSPLAKTRATASPVSGIVVEIIFYIQNKFSKGLDTTILFLFRGQETARFENGGQPAVTLEKS